MSNDELLQILSQSKNPLAVQPHLRKCFEAIENLDFASNLEISAMNSKEKEKVPFDKTMFPTGNVEIWLGERELILLAISVKSSPIYIGTIELKSTSSLLVASTGEVERRMRSSVRVQTEESIKAYATVARPQWVRDWPAMVVLAVSAIYWSQECEDSIKGRQNLGRHKKSLKYDGEE